jgi:subtilisin family serine protease
MLLVGAAGNAGPQSPPLYPAADEKVVAVTATDADDKLYARANVGPYVAVAAPGVDVLLPTPRGGYAFETGTSVSSALVSGVAALLLERRPASTPAELKRLLMTTATPLGTGAQAAAFGAGLVDARRAIMTEAAPTTN